MLGYLSYYFRGYLIYGSDHDALTSPSKPRRLLEVEAPAVARLGEF
jgi:hypothetical protein